MSLSVDLNADLGEGAGHDEELLGFVTSANIACGLHAGSPAMMRASLAAAQARGELNPDLDPRLLMTSLVGLTLFPAAGAPIWRALLGAEELGMDAVTRHALALLRDGAWARPR